MKNRSMPMAKMILIGLLVLDMAFGPIMAAAAERVPYSLQPSRLVSRSLPAVSVDAMPTNPHFEQGAHMGAETGTYMEVVQEQEKAVIEWDTFNIGQNGHVYFNQTNAAGDPMPGWSVLNRILDHNPSQIFGQLSADGKVFLINQNGFLFGPTARIVNLHTLAASSLNIAEEAFLDDIWDFSQEDYNGRGDANYGVTESPFVENQGHIDVQNGGAIYLMAPEVINSGTMNAPNGHAALIAGERIQLRNDESADSTRPQKLVIIPDAPGQADNRGDITAQGGVAGMYGGVVNQEGLITSVTAVYQHGTVELLASERIRTGRSSITGTPLAESDDTVDRTFETQESMVTLGRLQRSVGVEGGTAAQYDHPEQIDHYGVIEAPSGEVRLEAEQRIVLGEGSRIDVSGAWDQRSASENQIEMQLNSVELSDDFLARAGAMIGETIQVNALEGTDIGHIDSHLDQGEVTVAGRSTAGGTIDLLTTAENSDVIVEAGAEIKFAGGGIHYSAGSVQTSKVRIGNKIYDIGDIPDEVLERADQITLVGEQEAARLGATYIPAYQEGDDAGTLSIVTDTLVLNGELDGSVTRGTYQSLAEDPTVTIGELTYRTARGLREPEAGELVIGNPGPSSNSGTERRINAVVFNGDGPPVSIEEALEAGITYLSTDMLNSAGLGSLKVGANLFIDVQADARLRLAASHGTGELLFKARRIDHRGTIEMPGGKVAFYNDVNLTNGENVAENRPLTDISGNPVAEAIRLHAGSVIDVSGETWNNWNNPHGVPDRMHLDGGTILLQARGTQNVDQAMDASQGLFIDTGAVLDVSGGYSVGPRGAVSGGDAGGIELIGRTVQLNGVLSGHALLGYDGGKLRIATENEFRITHAPSDGNGAGTTTDTISDGWIAQSGFSHLDFSSDNNLIVENQAVLQPSTLKYMAPIPGLQAGGYVPSLDYQMEATTVSLTADAEVFSSAAPDSTQHLTISRDARVGVSGGGAISLKGSVIDIQGTLTARGGSVSAKATADDQDIQADGSYAAPLIIGSNASVDASGYVVQAPTPLATGLPRPYSIYAGGDVTLQASGSGAAIITEAGAQINVSGSPRVANYYRDMSGRRRQYDLAAAAGSITLEASQFDLQGSLLARNHMPNLPGGRLNILSLNYLQPYQIAENELLAYARSGFDAWQFSSVSAIRFIGDIDLSRERVEQYLVQDAAGNWVNGDWSLRELILDTPKLAADPNAPDQSVRIDATYIGVANLDEKYPGNITSSVHSPELTFSATPVSPTLELGSLWMDITGSVIAEGFGDVHFEAGRDMRLVEVFYEENPVAGSGQWAGRLAVAGDLTLTAGRIYPDTDTTFTISTGRLLQNGTWQGGDLTIAQSAEAAPTGPILSANGEIILQTHQLVHEGTLIAPMGRILLQGSGQGSLISLDENSVLSTASDTAVPWGFFQSDRWMRIDRTGDDLTDTVEVEAMPERRIDIVAETVVGRSGATIDVSGGGTVYAAQFEPSIKGSADPLSMSNRYVILPDHSVQLPGMAVHLEGVAGIETGTYSLLPAEYAFLPGAIILEDMGIVHDAERDYGYTAAGYAQTVGYGAYMGDSSRSAQAHLYVVRTAGDVLQEGAYRGTMGVAGDGGELIINSRDGRLLATYSGAGLSGYDGGRAWVSSLNMVLTSDMAAAGESEETLYFDPQSLLGSGFESVAFGAIDDLDGFSQRIGYLADAFSLLQGGDDPGARPFITETLVVKDTHLDAAALGLYAQDQIDIQSHVLIGSEASNELIMAAPDGSITISDDGTTTIEADTMGIYASDMEAGAQLDIGAVAAVVGTGRTELVDADYVAESGGNGDHPVLRMHSGLWSQFNEAEHVAVAGVEDIRTVGRIDTGSRVSFRLDTPLFVGDALMHDGIEVGPAEARFSAPILEIANSGNPEAGLLNGGPGTLSFSASIDAALEEDGIETGLLLVSGMAAATGFDQVQLEAQRDLVLAGRSGLRAPGDVTLTAGRVTAGGYVNSQGDYLVADATVTAGRELTIDSQAGQSAGTDRTPGGVLRFTADTIHHRGVIDNFSGGVYMQAQSALNLYAGASILADGGVKDYTIADETVSQAYAGGWVVLETQGAFQMQEEQGDSENPVAAAFIDVSNHGAQRPEHVDEATWAAWIDAGYLDAGQLAILAPETHSAAGLDGTLMGGASASYTDGAGRQVRAKGGDFLLTARTVDFSALNQKLSIGGFNHRVHLQGIEGDINVAAGDILRAEQIRLTADAGSIHVSGLLDATGRSDGRYIELFAGNDVNHNAGGVLDASGEAGWPVDGGDIFIGATEGFVNLFGAVDVSAASEAGEGGTVHLRARRYVTGDDQSTDHDDAADGVRMTLEGSITGARTVIAEAVRVYDESRVVNAATNDCEAFNSVGSITSAHLSRLQTQTGNYMTHALNPLGPQGSVVSRLQESLTTDPGTAFLFMPGIEIVRDGDIRLDATWDLSSGGWRYGDESLPGMLTIRAADNLTIAQDLTDRPHSAAGLLNDTDRNDSWSYTLTAGADLGSADALATSNDQGRFTIGSTVSSASTYRLVYTESGRIRFASGGDATIGFGKSWYFDANGSGTGSLRASATLASHDGDIMGAVGGNLTLAGNQAGQNQGVIQTATGDIFLDVGGHLTLNPSSAIRTTGVTTAELTEAMVSRDSRTSWLLTTFFNYTDPDSGETVNLSYYEAIAEYQLQNEPGYQWLSTYANMLENLTLSQFSAYAHGGDIDLSIGGNLTGSLNQTNLGFFKNYGAADMPADADMAGAAYVYTTTGTQRPTSGVVTMAGGDVRVKAGGRVGATDSGIADHPNNPDTPLGVQLAAFGEGDLTVLSGGNVDGRFLIADGRLDVSAMGSFGRYSKNLAIETIDSPQGPAVTIDIVAQDDIFLGTVIDPLMATYWPRTINSSVDENYYYTFHYTEETALRLSAINGSITLSGRSHFYDTNDIVKSALPPIVALTALDDITFQNDVPYWLAPGAAGGLTALAGGDIIGRNTDTIGRRVYAEVVVSNLAPEQVYHHLNLDGTYAQLTYEDVSSFFVSDDRKDGFLPVYVEAFDAWWDDRDEQWWAGLTDVQRAAYTALFARVHDPGYLLHAGDEGAMVFKAGGDIVNMAVNSPKRMEITASGEIRDNYFKIQHTDALDLSVVAAGERIVCSPLPRYYDYLPGGRYYSEDPRSQQIQELNKQREQRQSGIELSGAGDLLVLAGRAIDLGQSAGVRTLGNIWNAALAQQGADLTIVAGYDADAIAKNEEGQWDAAMADIFFERLLQGGIDYSALKYGEVIVDDERQTVAIEEIRGYGAAYAALLAGYATYGDVPVSVRDQLADLFLEELRDDTIGHYLHLTDAMIQQDSPDTYDMAYAREMTHGIDFERRPAAGDIRMTKSQLYTQSYGAINAIAAGNFDVGISSFGAKKSDSGINTRRGGDINVYTRNDLNVNESRIMSWFGGNIMIFADYGNINAGKGSKTTVSVSEPRVVEDEDGNLSLEYTLPAVGSGIRLLTYDPDGADGPMQAPDPGNGYFFAPEGEIDAGEAGIEGQGNLLLSALVVTNAQNIAVAGITSGASISQDSAADVSLSGSGGIVDPTRQGEEDSALSSTRDRFEKAVQSLSDALVPKWLSVEVTGMGTEETDEEEKEEEKQ